ncbi:MAG: inorganic phosphate transporter, partial [Nitrospinae bacterium]|nr:inorganic phosphate transporter [Nitrospinota bacterium]
MDPVFLIFIFLAALFLAYANGANDNFKGVATLYGSNTLTYKKALFWTTLTTVLGSLMSFYLAGELIIVFKGTGLVPENIIAMQSFPLAVGLAAALTVMLATFLNLPVSTTHALIGALAGAGWIASEAGINWVKLSEKFFLPLIGGPLLSVALAFALYPLFRTLRKKFKIGQETCFCLGEKVLATAPGHVASTEEFLKNFSESIALPEAVIADQAYCRSSYTGRIAGVSARSILDGLHYLSSGLVCFARGLNDTPKIAALLLMGSRFDLNFSIFMVGVIMMVGG